MENGRSVSVASIFNHPFSSQFILAFGVEKLVGAVVIVLRHKDLGGTIEVTVVQRSGVHKLLRRGDAVFFEHHHEHFGVDDGAGVKQFHLLILAVAGHG